MVFSMFSMYQFSVFYPQVPYWRHSGPLKTNCMFEIQLFIHKNQFMILNRAHQGLKTLSQGGNPLKMTPRTLEPIF